MMLQPSALTTRSRDTTAASTTTSNQSARATSRYEQLKKSAEKLLSIRTSTRSEVDAKMKALNISEQQLQQLESTVETLNQIRTRLEAVQTTEEERIQRLQEGLKCFETQCASLKNYLVSVEKKNAEGSGNCSKVAHKVQKIDILLRRMKEKERELQKVLEEQIHRQQQLQHLKKEKETSMQELREQIKYKSVTLVEQQQLRDATLHQIEQVTKVVSDLAQQIHACELEDEQVMEQLLLMESSTKEIEQQVDAAQSTLAFLSTKLQFLDNCFDKLSTINEENFKAAAEAILKLLGDEFPDLVLECFYCKLQHCYQCTVQSKELKEVGIKYREAEQQHRKEIEKLASQYDIQCAALEKTQQQLDECELKLHKNFQLLEAAKAKNELLHKNHNAIIARRVEILAKVNDIRDEIHNTQVKSDQQITQIKQRMEQTQLLYAEAMNCSSEIVNERKIVDAEIQEGIRELDTTKDEIFLANAEIKEANARLQMLYAEKDQIAKRWAETQEALEKELISISQQIVAKQERIKEAELQMEREKVDLEEIVKQQEQTIAKAVAEAKEHQAAQLSEFIKTKDEETDTIIFRINEEFANYAAVHEQEKQEKLKRMEEEYALREAAINEKAQQQDQHLDEEIARLKLQLSSLRMSGPSTPTVNLKTPLKISATPVPQARHDSQSEASKSRKNYMEADLLEEDDDLFADDF